MTFFPRKYTMNAFSPNALVIILFVIICVAVLAVNDLPTSMLVMSLLANTLFVITKICKSAPSVPDFTAETADPTPSAVEPASETAPPEEDAYGGEYSHWDSYRTAEMDAKYRRAANAPRLGPGLYDIDDKAVEIAYLRARERQTKESIAARDTNFYAFHFGDELDQAEKERWWGNKEI